MSTILGASASAIALIARFTTHLAIMSCWRLAYCRFGTGERCWLEAAPHNAELPKATRHLHRDNTRFDVGV